MAYFADPTPEMLAAEAEIGAAYEEARGLYGDEDGDAWIAALEDGTHPLCRVKTAAQSRGGCCPIQALLGTSVGTLVAPGGLAGRRAIASRTPPDYLSGTGP